MGKNVFHVFSADVHDHAGLQAAGAPDAAAALYRENQLWHLFMAHSRDCFIHENRIGAWPDAFLDCGGNVYAFRIHMAFF